MGAWLSYGLGGENENLPAFTVMISQGRGQKQALFSRLWNYTYTSSAETFFFDWHSWYLQLSKSVIVDLWTSKTLRTSAKTSFW